MQRLSVKPTLRGWWNYTMRSKNYEVYLCNDTEVHIDSEYSYNIRMIWPNLGWLVFLENYKIKAAILYTLVMHIVFLLISVELYIRICSGEFPGLTTLKELRRQKGTAVPLRDWENYRRLLLCICPLLRTGREGEYAVRPAGGWKQLRTIGLLRLGEVAILCLVTYLASYRLTGGSWILGLSGKYLLLFAAGTDVLDILLRLPLPWLELRLFPHCWERAYLAHPRKTIGEADDPSLSV